MQVYNSVDVNLNYCLVDKQMSEIKHLWCSWNSLPNVRDARKQWGRGEDTRLYASLLVLGFKASPLVSFQTGTLYSRLNK